MRVKAGEHLVSSLESFKNPLSGTVLPKCDHPQVLFF